MFLPPVLIVSKNRYHRIDWLTISNCIMRASTYICIVIFLFFLLSFFFFLADKFLTLTYHVITLTQNFLRSFVSDKWNLWWKQSGFYLFIYLFWPFEIATAIITVVCIIISISIIIDSSCGRIRIGSGIIIENAIAIITFISIILVWRAIEVNK